MVLAGGGFWKFVDMLLDVAIIGSTLDNKWIRARRLTVNKSCK